MDVQRQIKENAGDVNDFLKDLDSWAEEMKIKDNQLREQKLNKAKSEGKENSSPSSKEMKDKTDGQQPPAQPINTISMKHKEVNIKEPKKKEKERGKDKVPSPPKKERIKAYEYDKWDKFDVDEECGKIDDEGDETGDETSSGEEDELMENARLKQQAVAERERGNTLFKQAKYDKAIERYTAGIQIDPYCPLLPANRAMALLKIKKFGAAEQDCSLSLSLDPTYIKALQRRVAARTGLNKFNEALMDCQKILDLEPGNKLAQSEKEQLVAKLENSKSNTNTRINTQEAVKEEVKEKIEKLNLKDNIKTMFKPVKEKEKVEVLEPTSDVSPGLLLNSSGESRKEERAPWPSPDPKLIVHPIQKPPHQRSKKPLHQITILDKEPANPDKKKSTKGFRMPIIEVDGGEVEDATKNTKILDLPKEIPDNERFEEIPMEVDIPSKEDNTKKSSKIIEVASDDTKDVVLNDNKEESSHDDGFKSNSRGFCRKVEKDINEEMEISTSEAVSDEVPSAAKTSAQFIKDWRSLKSQQQRYTYLSQLNNHSYAAIFKSQMESKLFSEIIVTLSEAGTSLPSKSAAEHLLGLSSLPRISALSMFLSSSEQKLLTSILETAKDSLNDEGIQHVKSKLSL